MPIYLKRRGSVQTQWQRFGENFFGFHTLFNTTGVFFTKFMWPTCSEQIAGNKVLAMWMKRVTWRSSPPALNKLSDVNWRMPVECDVAASVPSLREVICFEPFALIAPSKLLPASNWIGLFRCHISEDPERTIAAQLPSPDRRTLAPVNNSAKHVEAFVSDVWSRTSVFWEEWSQINLIHLPSSRLKTAILNAN